MNYEQKFKTSLDKARGHYNACKHAGNESTAKILESIFPQLTESEDERIRKEMIEAISEIEPGKTYIRLSQEEKEAWIAWLEKQKEQPKEELVYRLNGLMQDYIKEGKDEEEREHRLKCYQLFWDALEDSEFFNRLESQKEELTELQERCKKFVEKQKEQKSAELPKSEDYGIDGLYAAVDILQKTLGEVDGYQTDDGILEHKCAISAVKELYEQKPAERATMQDFNYHEGESDKKACGRLIAILNYAEATSDDTPGEEVQALINWIEEKQKEQKPEDIMDEFTRNIRNLITDKLTVHTKGLDGSEISSTVFIDDKTAKDIASGVLFYVGKEATKNPNREIPEWSEEDKKMSYFVNQFLEYHEASDPTAKSCKEWFNNRLKSLRPQPQRRDTYYDIIHSILDMLKDKDFTQITPGHRVSLLNDIRVKCKIADECAEILDEPSWKPSEEQMDALKETISQDCTVCNGDTKWIKPNLESLYEQLKAL